MENEKGDKIADRDRYNKMSSEVLSGNKVNTEFGSSAIEEIYRAPYLLYEQYISENIQPHHTVLELGSGSGSHTFALLKTGAAVTASDIASSSLILLEKSLRPVFGNKLSTQVADMEMLPFENDSFDIVTSAGSLSYGDPSIVNKEIMRVLKPGGTFICVDSLNHNPVYKLNRYIQFIRKQRTKSTLERMPGLDRIKSITQSFSTSDIKYFGSITWTKFLVVRLVGIKKAVSFFDAFDKLINVKKSAFKFVLIGKNKL